MLLHKNTKRSTQLLPKWSELIKFQIQILRGLTVIQGHLNVLSLWIRTNAVGILRDILETVKEAENVITVSGKTNVLVWMSQMSLTKDLNPNFL